MKWLLSICAALLICFPALAEYAESEQPGADDAAPVERMAAVPEADTATQMLENLLSREDAYLESVSFEILDLLSHMELTLFTDNPIDNDPPNILMCAIPITHDGVTSKWLAVFTKDESVDFCIDQYAFIATGELFDELYKELMSNNAMVGIILNPYVDNYTIPKETVSRWAAFAENNLRLEAIQEKMASPDARLAGLHADIIVSLSSEVYLPYPIIVQENGEAIIFVCQTEMEGEKWLVVFTNEATLQDTMQKQRISYSYIEYYSDMFDRIARSAVDGGYAGMIVNPDSDCYHIDTRYLETLLEIKDP